MKKLFVSAVGVVGWILIVLSAFPFPANEKEPSAETTITSGPKPKPTRKPSVFSKKDAYLLMKIAMAEAEDEDTEGKALVMRVVLNRVKHKEFPDSIKKVIYHEKQFSPIANGRFDRVEPNKDCEKALDMIAEDEWDESEGALYFESKSDSTWHEDNLHFLFQHGNHYFYTDRG